MLLQNGADPRIYADDGQNPEQVSQSLLCLCADVYHINRTLYVANYLMVQV